MKNKKFRDFFSKAEITVFLITLFIVIFLILPAGYNILLKKSIELKLEKTYLALSQIADTAEINGVNFQYARYGDDTDEWVKIRNKGVNIIFKKNLKKELQDVELCENQAQCFNYTIKCLNGKICRPNNNGVNFKFNKNIVKLYAESKKNLENDYFINTNNNYELTYLIDINGAKGPNTVGKDVFLFIWNEQGLTPSGQSLVHNKDILKQKCFVSKATPENKGYPCLRLTMDFNWHIPKEVWKYKY